MRALSHVFWSLTVVMALSAADPGPPPISMPTHGGEAVEVLSTTRGRICLNGLWWFQPAVGSSTEAPASGWGWIRVPGSWTPRGNLPGVVAPGTGDAWTGFDGKTLGKAWYERSLEIPAAWAGRAVILELRRISTDARIFVDGQDLGSAAFPSGEIELTTAVRPGASHRLRLLVAAVDSDEQVVSAMGVGQNTMVAAKLATRGLPGEVFLSSRPRHVHIDDVFVQTSHRRNRLTLQTTLAGIATAGEARVEVQILDAAGAEVRRFTTTVPVAAGSPVITPAWDWPQAKRWDLGQPNLYTAVMRVQAPGMDDTWRQEFGFREVWIDGRDILLNGTPFRLRPCSWFSDGDWSATTGSPQMMAAAFDGLAGSGFNILEWWPSQYDERGTYHFQELALEIADRKGFPVMANSLSASNILSLWGGGTKKWTDPQTRATWRQRMESELRRLRNHPSCLIWATTANVYGHVDDQDPRRMGQGFERPVWAGESADWRANNARGAEMIAEVKQVDPTRPVMLHQGAAQGDIYATNNYLDLIPLQEREEWLSEWSRSGTMPYIAIEFGTPLHTTMMRGRNGFGDTVHSEPLLSEFCAIYQGGAAYANELPAYRTALREMHVKDLKWNNWHGNPALERSPTFQALQTLFITNTWRSWRTQGVTGGMVPWADPQFWAGRPGKAVQPAPAPGARGVAFSELPLAGFGFLRPEGGAVQPAFASLQAVNGPTLAWIAGPAVAGDPADFTAKDHSFRAGELLRKRVALLNDTRAPAAYTVRWSIAAGGKHLAGGDLAGTATVGATLLLPIEASLPAVAAITAGEVRIEAAISGIPHTDRFAFKVFPAAPARSGRLTVSDPKGLTSALLQRLGYTLDTGEPAPGGTWVIGREALSSQPLAGSQALLGRVRAHVQAGGRAVIFAQDPGWIERHLGLRVANHISRRIFPVSAADPLVAGLEAEDLRDWRGQGTLVEAKPIYGPTAKRSSTPWWGWHWGNRGSVCSAAIEKPHHAGWRPVLECEFDLAYSPLLELDHGAGRLTLCTLDLEDHAAADPVAELLAGRLLERVRSAALVPRGRTVYLGGEAGAALLDSYGLEYRLASDGRIADQAALVILGPDGDPAQAEAFARSGGRVFVLPRPASAFGLRVEPRADFGGSLAPPAWPEAAGLGMSDLRRRCAGPARLFVDGGSAEIGADGLLARLQVGKGVVVASQLDSAILEAEVKTYNRYTRWRLTRATCQVLANLGASFRLDARVFAPEDPGYDTVALAGSWKVSLTTSMPAAQSPGALKLTPISPAALALVTAEAPLAGLADVQVPGMWPGFEAVDGEAVFLRDVTVPAHLAGKDLVLDLGPVDDFDTTYVNGEAVGSTGYETANTWNTPRRYQVPGRLVRAGRNRIAVRVFDHFGGGGLGGQAYQLSLHLPVAAHAVGFYHADYRTDFDNGDDPYRYYRW